MTENFLESFVKDMFLGVLKDAGVSTNPPLSDLLFGSKKTPAPTERSTPPSAQSEPSKPAESSTRPTTPSPVSDTQDAAKEPAQNKDTFEPSFLEEAYLEEFSSPDPAAYNPSYINPDSVYEVMTALESEQNTLQAAISAAQSSIATLQESIAVKSARLAEVSMQHADLKAAQQSLPSETVKNSPETPSVRTVPLTTKTIHATAVDLPPSDELTRAQLDAITHVASMSFAGGLPVHVLSRVRDLDYPEVVLTLGVADARTITFTGETAYIADIGRIQYKVV